MITVDEMMSESPVGLAADDTLEKALAVMAKYGYHHIPVVKNSDELIGLVSHRDVLGALDSTLSPESRVSPAEVTLGEIMIKDVFSVAPGTNLRQAALFIRSERYGCLPVVSDGKLVGIITDSDFVNIAIDLLEQLEATEPPEMDQLTG